MKFKVLIICLVFGINPLLSAQEFQPLSEALSALAPNNIFPTDASKSFIFKDNSLGTKPATFEIRDNQQKPVFVTEVFASAPSNGDIQTTWKCTNPVKSGDVLLVRFAMRGLYAKQESGDAVVYLWVQETKADRLINMQLGAGPEWKVFDIPVVVKNNMDAGNLEITFTFGQLAQKVEVSDIQVLNFGQKVAFSQLPTTKFSYSGREANAPWRVAALKRIEKIRTAPLVVAVKDSQGKPVKGATVKAQLIDPEFIFGTAVTANLIAKEPLADSEIYRKNLLELFNAVTIDNGLKWGAWRDPKSQEISKQAVDWILEKKLRLRGHNLVWPGKKFTPAFFVKQPNFGPSFSDTITNHIKDIVTYAKGKVYGWDVINEMMHEKDYFTIMPRTQAVEWFKQAHRIDPKATMFINEYSMLNSIASPKNIKSYLELIAELLNGGAPITGIGVQGHVGRQPRNPEQVLTDLDMFIPNGIPVQVTEFDVNTPDDELQADYTRDFLIAVYSHPIVDGFTMWGFWEGAHWKPDAAMFRKDWTAKPNEAVWREWVTKKWRTSVTENTKTDGTVNSRGHLGTYEITVTNGKQTKTQMYQLSKNAEPLVIKM